jgi:uncharacterized protein YyaL (SSP411 family)
MLAARLLPDLGARLAKTHWIAGLIPACFIVCLRERGFLSKQRELMRSIQATRILRYLVVVSALFFGWSGTACCEGPATTSKTVPLPVINWRPWNESLFEEAQRDKKLIILDLEAVWCHWCHVMEEETYSQRSVIDTIRESFIPMRADQDAQPDLAARFGEFGWPATIIFNSKGEEIAALSGFIEPEEMHKALLVAISKPIPLPKREQKISSAAVHTLPTPLREQLLARHGRAVDRAHGGLKTSHKYLDPGSIEFALGRARDGDASEREWVVTTLKENQKLIDPVWGGVYQYSARGDWDHPHYEKLLSTQCVNIKLYSLAFRVLKDPAWLASADNVARYILSFLRSPEEVFYVSQDADIVKGEHSESFFALGDVARRAIGAPRIDTRLYARENGLAIEALSELYAASGEQKYRNAAEVAARWIISQRLLPGGGYSHGDSDIGGPFLSDTLAAGRGFLSLFSVTADREWLAKAASALDFIATHFRDTSGVGYLSASSSPEGILKPVRNLDDNVRLSRFARLMFSYLGDARYDQVAREAFSFCANEEVALDSISEPIILLAEEELSSEPAHFTVVGSKDDPAAKALWGVLLQDPRTFVRREWWDRKEGPMQNSDVTYPSLPKPAAFICIGTRCSPPIFAENELREKLMTSLSGVKSP